MALQVRRNMAPLRLLWRADPPLLSLHYLSLNIARNQALPVDSRCFAHLQLSLVLAGGLRALPALAVAIGPQPASQRAEDRVEIVFFALSTTIAHAEKVHQSFALLRLPLFRRLSQFLLQEPLPLVLPYQIELDLLVRKIVKVPPLLLKQAQLFLPLLDFSQLFYLHVVQIDLVRYLLQRSLRVHHFLQGGSGRRRTAERSRRGLSLV